MTTISEMRAKLAQIENRMGEKGIPQPRASYHVNASGRECIHLDGHYETKAFNGERYEVIFGNDIGDLFQAAFDYIRSLPDPAVAARVSFQRNLASVIDEGHALNLPDDVMTPLRAGSQAMTENLLTMEKPQ